MSNEEFFALLVTLLAFSGCATTPPPGPDSVSVDSKPETVVRTKGNYSVAAHCFSRAFRDGGCKYLGGYNCDYPPQVEVAPDTNFGEFYLANSFDVIFRNTADGNSEGEFYLFSRRGQTSSARKNIVNWILDRTERCQLKDSHGD
jgi:hypothetical protein